MILVWAPPTRDTERPGLMAGRIPALNKSVSRKIWPSVIEITLVGTNADTSPAWVSMIGRAVSEPVCPSPPVGQALDLIGIDAGGPFQQAGMQIEHVTGESFTTRRTAQQQRDLAIGHSLLGQVIIDDEGILARSRKYSPIAQPEYGAVYSIAADSEALAATTMV